MTSTNLSSVRKGSWTRCFSATPPRMVRMTLLAWSQLIWPRLVMSNTANSQKTLVSVAHDLTWHAAHVWAVKTDRQCCEGTSGRVQFSLPNMVFKSTSVRSGFVPASFTPSRYLTMNCLHYGTYKYKIVTTTAALQKLAEEHRTIPGNLAHLRRHM